MQAAQLGACMKLYVELQSWEGKHGKACWDHCFLHTMLQALTSSSLILRDIEDLTAATNLTI